MNEYKLVVVVVVLIFSSWVKSRKASPFVLQHVFDQLCEKCCLIEKKTINL